MYESSSKSFFVVARRSSLPRTVYSENSKSVGGIKFYLYDKTIRTIIHCCTIFSIRSPYTNDGAVDSDVDDNNDVGNDRAQKSIQD